MRTPLLAGAVLMIGAAAAQAAPLTFATTFGPEVFGATGSGSATVVIDTVANTLSIVADWSGLSGTTTVAHIHCCTAVPGAGTIGVAVTPGTLPGFPVGFTAGSYGVVLDTESPATYTAGFVSGFGGGTLAGAEAALLAGFQAGTAYLNLHTTRFPSGEIRGFLAAVPEPATLALFGLGIAGLAAMRRRA